MHKNRCAEVNTDVSKVSVTGEDLRKIAIKIYDQNPWITPMTSSVLRDETLLKKWNFIELLPRCKDFFRYLQNAFCLYTITIENLLIKKI